MHGIRQNVHPFFQILLFVALASTPAFLAGFEVDVEGTNNPDREELFMDWGLGMFIHWSLDAELGSVISHNMIGASDDYLDRYFNELPKYFDAKDFDPEEWVRLAKMAGFKYMVFTTKHHNGFCMWPTATTDFSILNTPFGEDGKDIVRMFVNACRKYDMKVGFYFSPEDFHFLHENGHTIRRGRVEPYQMISTNPELLAYNKRQLDELFTQYGPIDVAFVDSRDYAAVRDYIHKLQPDCIVTRGAMTTPEQNVPDEPMPGPWEACYTLGTQWQFKPTNEVYKSGTELINMLIDIRAKGGNLLINMGPEPSGKIPFEQERTFRELGLWMFVNREAIHDIRPAPRIKEGDLYFTRCKDDPSVVYVFIPQGEEHWSLGARREFTIESLTASGEVKISVLGQNDLVVSNQHRNIPTSRAEVVDEGLEISVVRAQRLYNNTRWPNPITVKLEGVQFKD